MNTLLKKPIKITYKQDRNEHHGYLLGYGVMSDLCGGASSTIGIVINGVTQVLCQVKLEDICIRHIQDVLTEDQYNDIL